jgi:hypothetical protein
LGFAHKKDRYKKSVIFCAGLSNWIDFSNQLQKSVKDVDVPVVPTPSDLVKVRRQIILVYTMHGLEGLPCLSPETFNGLSVGTSVRIHKMFTMVHNRMLVTIWVATETSVG